MVFARRGGYCGGEPEASARSTVFFAQPTSLAILRIDNPCPRRYRICAHCSKEITHPIFFEWATFRGAFWATFQRALTHTIVEDLVGRGVSVRFLREGQTYSAKADPIAKLMLRLMGSVAEFERFIIKERQSEGIARAKARGAYNGRAKVLTDAQVAQARGVVGRWYTEG